MLTIHAFSLNYPFPEISILSNNPQMPHERVQTGIIHNAKGFGVAKGRYKMLNETIRSMTKEQLLELMEIDAKDSVALDGVWFQSVERKFGMDEAMYHDQEAWKRFSPVEARRIKKFLGLGEHPGLEGLAKALPLHIVDRANKCEVIEEEGRVINRVIDCRVQSARSRKGMEYHPCKLAAIYEYSCFASAIDDRIECKCLSCYPDVTDETCSCSWEFTLKKADENQPDSK